MVLAAVSLSLLAVFFCGVCLLVALLVALHAFTHNNKLTLLWFVTSFLQTLFTFSSSMLLS